MASIQGEEKIKPPSRGKLRQIQSSLEHNRERRFMLEEVIGEGHQGFAIKCRTSGSSSPSRTSNRFVMKRAVNSKEESRIRHEIDTLRGFHGASHIQQLFRINGEARPSEIPYLAGPTLLTEWIQNGSLRGMIDRKADWDHPLPNRLLWRIFFNLCRMLTAMAWPGNRGALPAPNVAGQRPQQSDFVHGDFNVENIMIGDFDAGEHALVPRLKLIDFAISGSMSPSQPMGAASRVNMLHAGIVMVTLIGGGRQAAREMTIVEGGVQRTIMSHAGDLDRLSVQYKAPAAVVNRQRQKTANLDPDLRALIVRCSAQDLNQRPSLDDLFETIQHNVGAKQQNNYVGKESHANESNDQVRRIAEQLMRLKP